MMLHPEEIPPKAALTATLIPFSDASGSVPAFALFELHAVMEDFGRRLIRPSYAAKDGTHVPAKTNTCAHQRWGWRLVCHERNAKGIIVPTTHTANGRGKQPAFNHATMDSALDEGLDWVRDFFTKTPALDMDNPEYFCVVG